MRALLADGSIVRMRELDGGDAPLIDEMYRTLPVLTLRSGSSDAGQRAVASHTASGATPRVTRDALFRQAGVLAVDRLDELSALIATLSWQPLPAGRRVAVISNAGGAGVLAADACVAGGLELPPPSAFPRSSSSTSTR